MSDCANIMISTVVDYLNTEDTILEKIYIVLFDIEAYEVFNQTFDIRA